MQRVAGVPAAFRGLGYGIDVPVQYSSPRAAIDGALAYLEKVDPEYTASSREMLLPLVSQFLGSGGSDEVRGVSLDKHAALPIDVRNAYTAAIADLIAHFQRKRVDYLGRSSEESYEWGYRHAVVARQLDNAFRATASDITREGSVYLSAETWTARDRGMADNLLWALEREGPDGRIFIWAHNAHLQKFPVQFGEVSYNNNLGLFLHSLLGHDYLSVGFAYNSGAETGWDSYQTDARNAAKPGSLDGQLARVGLPMFVLGGSVLGTGAGSQRA